MKKQLLAMGMAVSVISVLIGCTKQGPANISSVPAEDNTTIITQNESPSLSQSPSLVLLSEKKSPECMTRVAKMTATRINSSGLQKKTGTLSINPTPVEVHAFDFSALPEGKLPHWDNGGWGTWKNNYWIIQEKVFSGQNSVIYVNPPWPNNVVVCAYVILEQDCKFGVYARGYPDGYVSYKAEVDGHNVRVVKTYMQGDIPSQKIIGEGYCEFPGYDDAAYYHVHLCAYGNALEACVYDNDAKLLGYASGLDTDNEIWESGYPGLCDSPNGSRTGHVIYFVEYELQ